jgi:hypothetical protein
MKKFLLIFFTVLLLVGAVVAKEWQDYTDFSGTIADTDTFMFRDLSDTTDDAVYGTLVEIPYSQLKDNMDNFDDFGFPYGANPTTNAEAECHWDSDDDMLECYNGSTSGAIATFVKCFPPVILAEPDELQPIADVWTIQTFPAEMYPGGFEITAIQMMTPTNNSDSLNFEEWTNTGTFALVGTVETIAFDGDHFAEDDGTLADSIIAADGILRVDLPATPTDVESYEITVCGYIKEFN